MSWRQSSLMRVAAIACCWCIAAAPLAPSQAGPAASAGKTKYDLAWRPAVGMRWAYEESLDQRLDVSAAAVTGGGGAGARELRKFHQQLVVSAVEITGLRNTNDSAARRIAFGPNCWWAEQVDNKPVERTKLVYGGRTVNFRLSPDGQIEQDFGVKPTGPIIRRLCASLMRHDVIFADHPVAVGERWRADEAVRPLLDVRPGDMISTIVTLKSVRDGADGRPVADLALSAGAITTFCGFRSEVSIEGTFTADVATGLVLKCDLVGRCDIADTPEGRDGRAGGMKVAGTGSAELHRSARLLPAAAAAATASPAETPAARAE